MAKPTIFDCMMHDYCVGKGYCGSVIDGKPSHVTLFIPEHGLVTADQFVTWLLKAEGVYNGDIKVRKELIKIFKKHMKSYEVDASILR